MHIAHYFLLNISECCTLHICTVTCIFPFCIYCTHHVHTRTSYSISYANLYSNSLLFKLLFYSFNISLLLPLFWDLLLLPANFSQGVSIKVHLNLNLNINVDKDGGFQVYLLLFTQSIILLSDIWILCSPFKRQLRPQLIGCQVGAVVIYNA